MSESGWVRRYATRRALGRSTGTAPSALGRKHALGSTLGSLLGSLLGSTLAFAMTFGSASEARADATGWASVNGGASVAQPAVDETTGVAPDGELRSQLSFDTGVGTSPAAPFIVGGIFRVAPTLGEHTDFSWSARVATRGFQTGPIGIALDVGMYARAGDVASIGLVGGPILGGPLGLQLAVMGHLGSEEEKGASALLGIDLLRLTMYRESLLDWWPNPLRPDERPSNLDTARR